MNKAIDYLYSNLSLKGKELKFINQYLINLELDIKRNLLELSEDDILYKELNSKYFLIKGIVLKIDDAINELHKEL